MTTTPQRLQAKLIFDDSTELRIKEFIPVFHNWIQKQDMDDLLVDVHDYSHMHHGPGILLVAHESDYAVDLGDGRPGLIYRRKRNSPENLNDLLQLTLQRVVKGAIRLETDDSLSGPPRFRTDEFVLNFLDRLAWPNDPSTFEKAEPALTAAMEGLFGNEGAGLERIGNDPREPLSVRLKLADEPLLKELAGALETGAVQSNA